jgi:hypothetical protein
MTDAALIDAVVVRAGLEGWNDATLRAALRDRGEDPALLESHFPRGVTGAIADWIALTDQRMEAAAAGEDLLALRTPARIRRLIELRLHLIEPDLEALRGAFAVLALPWNLGTALRATAPLGFGDLARSRRQLCRLLMVHAQGDAGGGLFGHARLLAQPAHASDGRGDGVPGPAPGRHRPASAGYVVIRRELFLRRSASRAAEPENPRPPCLLPAPPA